MNSFFKRVPFAFCRLSFAVCLLLFAFYLTACAVSARESSAGKKSTAPAKDRHRSSARDPRSSTSVEGPRASIEAVAQPAVPLPPYRLSFGDVIEIRFFGNPEFNVTTAIRPDGRIALEKVGEHFVIGMTPEELNALIIERFSRFIKSPEVTVIVRDFGKRNVFVLGEVNSPGAYEIEPGMTVLRAISRAGGYTLDAKLNSVILMRNEYYQQPQAIRLNLANFPAKTDLSQDPLTEPNDIVYVPRTFIGQLNNFVERFFTRFVMPPLDTYLRVIFFTRAYR